MTSPCFSLGTSPDASTALAMFASGATRYGWRHQHLLSDAIEQLAVSGLHYNSVEMPQPEHRFTLFDMEEEQEHRHGSSNSSSHSVVSSGLELHVGGLRLPWAKVPTLNDVTLRFRVAGTLRNDIRVRINAPQGFYFVDEARLGIAHGRTSAGDEQQQQAPCCYLVQEMAWPDAPSARVRQSYLSVQPVPMQRRTLTTSAIITSDIATLMLKCLAKTVHKERRQLPCYNASAEATLGLGFILQPRISYNTHTREYRFECIM